MRGKIHQLAFMENFEVLGKKIDRKTVDKLNEVLRELKGEKFKQISASCWRAILVQKDLRLFVYKEKDIVGMAILRWHDLPIGRVGTVEDVVVKDEYRGKGYGTELMRAIIEFAKKQKIVYIDLTSKPERVAANALYQKLGWKKRATNVYRLEL